MLETRTRLHAAMPAEQLRELAQATAVDDAGAADGIAKARKGFEGRVQSAAGKIGLGGDKGGVDALERRGDEVAIDELPVRGRLACDDDHEQRDIGRDSLGSAATVDPLEHCPAWQQCLDDRRVVRCDSEDHLVAGQRAKATSAQESLPAPARGVLDDNLAPVTRDDQAAAFDVGHPATIPA